MDLARRRFIRLTGATISASLLARPAWSLDCPTRQVRVVVGYAAGGASDILARLVGQRLSDRPGQSFVIENRPGANSNLAAEIVINSPPDGYTLLVSSTGAAINTSLYDKLNSEIDTALADPSIKARVADLGGVPLTGSPAVFGKFLVDETDKRAKVVKFAGIEL